MECPICYEQISKDTGQVTTSCGHSFHFKCLNTWYWQQSQNEEGRESCPCCRKEPGEYELASTVSDESDESTEMEWEDNEEEGPEWVRVGPGRWIVPSDEPDRLRILARVADEERKRHEFAIPPYNPENHALWVLRNFFEEPSEAPTQQEVIHPLDRSKLVRRRRRSFGRPFWAHLGSEHKLTEIDGYKSD